eukprot:COSAG04_NODE_4707_length_1935_cov_4.017974_3_plen_72_part_01
MLDDDIDALRGGAGASAAPLEKSLSAGHRRRACASARMIPACSIHVRQGTEQIPAKTCGIGQAMRRLSQTGS